MSGKSLLALATFLAIFFCAFSLACQNDENEDASDDDIGLAAQNITDSGCLNGAFDAYDSSFDEALNLTWDGEGKLSVYHGPTCKNCGFILKAAMYTVTEELIKVVEESTDDFQGLWCICPFTFSYDLIDIPAGDYQFEVYTLEHDENPTTDLDWQETISLPEGEPAIIELSLHHNYSC